MSANEITPALELRHVGKMFGTVPAVEAVSVSAAQGEVVTLLGPSGSGKTTLLKMIAGFELPTTGSIWLGHRDISHLTPGERNIGMVFQNYALFPHLTVAENVEYGLRMRKWPRDKRRQRSTEMLELVGLPGFGTRNSRSLSGGQQQRVALARALAFDPDLLLMDEPLGALDRELRLRMVSEIRRIQKDTGRTIVYVTHDQEEAMTLSDRIAVLNHGKVVTIGSSTELVTLPTSAFVARFLGGANLLPVDTVGPAKDGVLPVRFLDQQMLVRIGGARVAPKMQIAIRPHQIRSVSGDGALRLSGTVRDYLFLGEFVQFTLFNVKYGELTVRWPSDHLHRARPDECVNLFVYPQDIVAVSIDEN